MEYRRQTKHLWNSQSSIYGTRLLWQRKEKAKENKFVWHAQPIGPRWFYSYPKAIAKFCGLKNWWRYSGHSIRATSASFYVEGQRTLLQLKSFGGWKNDKSAEGYYRNSVRNKNEDANTFNDIIGVKQKEKMEVEKEDCLDDNGMELDDKETSKKAQKMFSNCSF
eukprot:469477_1